MTEPEFWTLIEASRPGDSEAQVDRLIDALAIRPVAEILSFGQWWDTLKVRAYQWPLWGAAYLMNGGCSDDGFSDFRSWLLLKGEFIFKAALEDADWLAKIEIERDEASCECYPAPTAYEMTTGTKEHNLYYNALSVAYGIKSAPDDPLGEEWDFDDNKVMKKRLPKLFKKFGDA